MARRVGGSASSSSSSSSGESRKAAKFTRFRRAPERPAPAAASSSSSEPGPEGPPPPFGFRSRDRRRVTRPSWIWVSSTFSGRPAASPSRPAPSAPATMLRTASFSSTSRSAGSIALPPPGDRLRVTRPPGGVMPVPVPTFS